MSLPKEGSRDVDEGIIVSMVPDICLTPAGGGMVPVPYTIWCRQADAANLTNSVRQTDDRSHALASIVLKCYGDEPGTGGGVYSGTTGAECTPKTWSQNVRAEDRNLVRHTDEWWMNHKNTYGILIYVKDMNSYNVPPVDNIQAKMVRGFTQPENIVMTAQPAQLPQASVAVPGAGGSGVGIGSAVQAGVVVGNTLSDKLPENFRRGYNWNSVAALLGLPHVRITGKCPQGVFCWPGPKDPSQMAEYQAQLSMQNATINTLNPCHYLMNRATFIVFGSAGMQNYSKAARNAARNAFTDAGGDASGLAATHPLDMVGGGNPEAISGLRSAAVNTQLGNQWKTLRHDVDAYASLLCENGCPKMKAIFRIC